MKKSVAFILALALIFALCACGQQAAEAPTPAEPVQTETTPAPAEEAPAEEPVADEYANWPEDTITIIAGAEPGGSLDVLARGVQPFLQKELGVDVIVENVPGASGRKAAAQAWGSKPDGYTILAVHNPMMYIGDIVYDGDYEILGFTPLVSWDVGPNVLVVGKDSKYNTVADLVEDAKVNTLSNSTAGVGSSMHLQSLIFKGALGIDYTDIPYDGAAPAIMGVLNHDVDFCIVPFNVAYTNVDQLKVLAVLSNNPLDCFPDAPTLEETGYSCEYVEVRRALVAPPDTPKEIADKIIAALLKAAEDPECQAWMEDKGIIIDVLSGDEYTTQAQAVYDKITEYKSYFVE